MTWSSPRSRKQVFRALGLLSSLLPGAAFAGEPAPKISALDQFAACTERWEADQCLKALQVYVQAHPAQAFDAGKTVTLSLNHWAAVPFFHQALAAKVAPGRCGEQRLALAVLSGLALPSEGVHRKTVSLAASILSDKCWNELQAPALKELSAEGAGSYLTGNLCPILASKQVHATPCDPKPEPAATRPAAPQWEPLDPRTLQVEDKANVYSGDKGRRITLAKVKGKNYFLIKFEGFRGPWEGNVLLHREDDLGDRGYDYWLQDDGARWVSVVMRKSWGGEAYEVYPKGDKGPFRVVYDEKLSRTANAKALLAQLGK
jgi:hypothetical protein